jgi:hypothetical protein
MFNRANLISAFRDTLPISIIGAEVMVDILQSFVDERIELATKKPDADEVVLMLLDLKEQVRYAQTDLPGWDPVSIPAGGWRLGIARVEELIDQAIRKRIKGD